MHNAALQALGIDAGYKAQDVPPEQLKTALEGLRQSGAWGANLSIPHKQAVLDLLDSISAEAKIIGAVNTMVVKNGLLEGHNTDAYGFMRSLEEAGIRVHGTDVVVLGAGGAARAVTYGLKQAGARVAVWNRNNERARVLANELGLAGFISDQLLQNAIDGAVGLVNTTSVGLEQPDLSPIEDKMLPKIGEPWVCDIVYRPLETRLLRVAKKAGIQTVDGLGMLVHQGAKAFELWTGLEPDTKLMRQVAMQELGF